MSPDVVTAKPERTNIHPPSDSRLSSTAFVASPEVLGFPVAPRAKIYKPAIKRAKPTTIAGNPINLPFANLLDPQIAMAQAEDLWMSMSRRKLTRRTILES